MSSLQDDNPHIHRLIMQLAVETDKAHKSGTGTIHSWQLTIQTVTDDAFGLSGGCCCRECRQNHVATSRKISEKMPKGISLKNERVH